MTKNEKRVQEEAPRALPVVNYAQAQLKKADESQRNWVKQVQQQAQQQTQQNNQKKQYMFGGLSDDKLQQAIQQQTDQRAKTYTGLEGLSQNTAQQLGASQQGYTPSAAVLAAQQTLQQLQDSKPQGYESRFGDKLDQMLEKILNPDKFNYSFDGDALAKQMAERYKQNAKLAMMDSMGQAAALTGGYGNSYGQQAGQTAYQQQMLGLYDKQLELQDRAWDRYKYGQQQLADQYNQLQNADATEYNRYLDRYNQWSGERDYAANRYDTEYSRDYGQYSDRLNYWTQMAGLENQDFRTKQQAEEAKREWDKEFNYKQMTADRAYAYDICTAILANGKMPSDEQLKAAGISKSDAKKMMKQVTKSGGRGRKTTNDTSTADAMAAAGQITGAAGIGSLTAEALKELYMQQGLLDSRNGRRG